MGHYLRSHTVVFLVVFLLIDMGIIAQNTYTDKALTGRGDLLLTDDNSSLQPEVHIAFQKMAAAALEEGIEIKIVSGYRSFDRQLLIWNNKFKEYSEAGLNPTAAIAKIVAYSTLPGTSRHHWGTDIDIIDGNTVIPEDVLLERHFEEHGVFSKLKKWMDKNGNRFGFYLVYPDISDRKGFHYEPWHYTYKDVSVRMLQEFKTIDLHKFMDTIDLNGKEFITDKFLRIYRKNNILDINPELKKG